MRRHIHLRVNEVLDFFRDTDYEKYSQFLSQRDPDNVTKLVNNIARFGTENMGDLTFLQKSGVNMAHQDLWDKAKHFDQNKIQDYFFHQQTLRSKNCKLFSFIF